MFWTKLYRTLSMTTNLRGKVTLLILFLLGYKVYFLWETIKPSELITYLGKSLYTMLNLWTTKMKEFSHFMKKPYLKVDDLEIKSDEKIPLDNSHIIHDFHEISLKLDSIEKTLQNIHNHAENNHSITSDIMSSGSDEWRVLGIASLCISLFFFAYLGYKYYQASQDDCLNQEISCKMTSLIDAQSELSKFGIEKNIQGVELTNSILLDFIRESTESTTAHHQNIRRILNQIVDSLHQIEAVTQYLKIHMESYENLSDSVAMMEEDTLQILFFIKSVVKVMELDPSSYLP